MSGTYILRKDSPESIRYFSETVKLADFTDGAGTSGTVVLKNSFPVGALVMYAALSDIVGFIGDTSAVVTIGDGTDVDRYNTGTPSVFATATGGIALGVPSGVQYHAAAKNITVTVTSAADFTSITAGSLTLHFYYLLAE